MLRKLIPVLLLLLFATSVTAAVQNSYLASSSQIIKLGTDEYRGIVATAQLQQLPGDAATDGNYLLTVSFSTTDDSSVPQNGDVAVKILSPDEHTSDPVRLNLIDDYYQSEIQLSGNGEFLITVGSKLDDDKKRIFQFFYFR